MLKSLNSCCCCCCFVWSDSLGWLQDSLGGLQVSLPFFQDSCALISFQIIIIVIMIYLSLLSSFPSCFMSLLSSHFSFSFSYFFSFSERERERERERFFGMLPRFLEVFASPPRSVPGRNSANQFQEKEPLSGGGGILRDARGSLTQTDGDSITRDRCEETETDASGFSQIGSRCSKDRDS